MNCKSASRLFSDRIGGSLDTKLGNHLQAHLDRCPDCVELLEIMELNIVQLEGVPEPPLPSGLMQRLTDIPRQEQVKAGRPAYTGSEGHWLFSNAAAAVILGIFITANLTWFNPDFQDSIVNCRKLINDKGTMALEKASDWGEEIHQLKEQVDERLRVTDIIRALGLIGA